MEVSYFLFRRNQSLTEHKTVLFEKVYYNCIMVFDELPEKIKAMNISNSI